MRERSKKSPRVPRARPPPGPGPGPGNAAQAATELGTRAEAESAEGPTGVADQLCSAGVAGRASVRRREKASGRARGFGREKGIAREKGSRTTRGGKRPAETLMQSCHDFPSAVWIPPVASQGHSLKDDERWLKADGVAVTTRPATLFGAKMMRSWSINEIWAAAHVDGRGEVDRADSGEADGILSSVRLRSGLDADADKKVKSWPAAASEVVRKAGETLSAKLHAGTSAAPVVPSVTITPEALQMLEKWTEQWLLSLLSELHVLSQHRAFMPVMETQTKLPVDVDSGEKAMSSKRVYGQQTTLLAATSAFNAQRAEAKPDKEKTSKQQIAKEHLTPGMHTSEHQPFEAKPHDKVWDSRLPADAAALWHEQQVQHQLLRRISPKDLHASILSCPRQLGATSLPAWLQSHVKEFLLEAKSLDN